MITKTINTKSSRSKVEKHSEWSVARKQKINEILTLSEFYEFSTPTNDK